MQDFNSETTISGSHLREKDRGGGYIDNGTDYQKGRTWTRGEGVHMKGPAATRFQNSHPKEGQMSIFFARCTEGRLNPIASASPCSTRIHPSLRQKPHPGPAAKTAA